MATGFFIQYKFITPANTKHSSYMYQKLFRALYGYTQNVSKSNGKTYKYPRKGILSSTPYIRSGKNCVIIPSAAFNPLVTFFKTGKNPSHFWRNKGDWKAVYYMDEKNLKEDEVVLALENQLDRTFLLTSDNEPKSAFSELLTILTKVKVNSRVDRPYLDSLLAECEKIVSTNWFKECYLKSEKLTGFFNNFKALKSV